MTKVRRGSYLGLVHLSILLARQNQLSRGRVNLM